LEKSDLLRMLQENVREGTREDFNFHKQGQVRFQSSLQTKKNEKTQTLNLPLCSKCCWERKLGRQGYKTF
jgi:hypothetical protein